MAAFYAAYRQGGHGRAAHHPALMVALYAYTTGRHSSRVIERARIEDVAVGALAANQRPDHRSIARFPGATRLAWLVCSASVVRCVDAGLTWRCWRWMGRTCTRTRRTS